MEEKTIMGVIRSRLEDMTKMASILTDHKDEVNQYIGKDCYVRIGGQSFRAVSLKDSYPLCGCGKSGAKNFNAIKAHFDQFIGTFDAESDKRIKPLSEEILEKKQERRLQCWIIREALKRDRDLLGPLCIKGKQFDQLLFALDEVSLGDRNHPVDTIEDLDLKKENEKKINAVRCDILAVGKQGAQTFPVIIELKSNRDMKKLEQQLSNFTELMKNFENEFKDLLKICTGSRICDWTPRKIIIWPAPENKTRITQRHLQDLANNKKISILEYSKHENGSYKFESYWARV